MSSTWGVGANYYLYEHQIVHPDSSRLCVFGIFIRRYSKFKFKGTAGKS
jgi:hypothetical protein